MGLEHVRNEIEHLRLQIRRQRKDILALQRAGLSLTASESLLGRMQAKVDALCVERDRLNGEARQQAPKQLKGPPVHRRA